MGAFDNIGEELFKRQVKYKNGRHWIDIPFQEQERMLWIGSTHISFLNNYFHDKFGDEIFIETYRVSKLYGLIFGSRITSLVKTPRLIAPMLTLIVKQFGWGKIETEKTKYEDDWLSFKFYDLPFPREIFKYFGKQQIPLDYMVAGLIAGSAEQLLKRKFITVETNCIATGDSTCYFETLSVKNFENRLQKISNNAQKKILEKILQIEKNTDFLEEIKKIKENKNKEAITFEQDYLKKEGIR